jgi:peptidoglycan/xylan/chitin deacetylase (PgdA/CDA1 family)
MSPRGHRWLVLAIGLASTLSACERGESAGPVSSAAGTAATSTIAGPVTTESTVVLSTVTTTAPSSTLPATTTAPSPTSVPTTTPPSGTQSATTTTQPPATVAPTTSAPATGSTVETSSTAPTSGRSIVIDRLPTDDRVIALTFDAGSDLGNTGMVLDTLAAKGVVASFGITGEFAEAHPDSVRRMAREGHVVINHSYSHSSFTGFSSDDVLATADERQRDLLHADEVLSALTGSTTAPLWRPPFGDYDDGVLEHVGAIGFGFTVMWTIDSLGWQGISVDDIVARVLDRASPGAIVVMHVGSQSDDAFALAGTIDGLRAMGYEFTAISESSIS